MGHWLSPREVALAGVWEGLLGRDDITRDDRFLDLGGDSLSAIALVAQAGDVFGVDLPLTAPLDVAPTVASMAALIDELRAAGGQRVALPADGATALSPAQERMWVLQQLDPTSSAYNVPMATRLRGPLDVDALRRSLADIVERHDVLHSRFASCEGKPQLVLDGARPTGLDVIDLTGERDPFVTARVAGATLAAESFDLAAGPVFRSALYRVGDDDHLFVVVFHHIATDATSRDVIRAELAEVYPAHRDGRPTPLPPLAVQFPALAAAQRQSIDGGALVRSEAYWTDVLTPLPPPLALVTDRRRPRQWDPRGEVISLDIGGDIRNRVHDVAQQHGATMFMVLVATFAELVRRYSTQDDFIVGAPVAGRLDARSAGVVGPFLNTVPIRVRLDDGLPFAETLRRVRAACLGAYEHQAVPFERIVDLVNAPRALDHAPVVQALFQLRNRTSAIGKMGDLALEEIEVTTGGAKLDLSVDAVDHGDRLTVRFEYPSALFDAPTIERMAHQYQALLAAATAHPAAVLTSAALLDDAECSTLTAFSTDGETPTPAPAHTVPDRVRTIAATAPSAVALCGPFPSVTYEALVDRADALTRQLVGLGCGRGARVGVLLPRGDDLVVAMLAVMGAGAAVVPLDPGFPSGRLDAIVRGADVSTVVATEALVGHVTAANIVCIDRDRDAIEAAAAPLPTIDIDAPAYVIATSGSTGEPKLVAITHRAFAGFLDGLAARLGFDGDLVFLASTPVSFDPSLRELLLPLVVGGRSVVAGDALAADIVGARELIETHQPNVVQGTPTTLRLLLDAGWSPTDAVTVLSCGERLQWELANRLAADARAVWNLYGPTETTQCAVVHRVVVEDDAVSVPVGRPLPGVVIDVRGADGGLTPIGVPGQIAIGGPGVGRYLGQGHPEAFVDRPGGRQYLTGDMGRWRADGLLECLGRNDDQMKRHGVRVEPGDVEACLLSHPMVVSAAVAMRGARLTAWVTASGPVTNEELRAHAAALLPRALMPDALAVLDSMPLLSSGKIDRSALPTIDVVAGTGDAPAGPTEEALAELWSAVLGVDNVSRTDDFFVIGGHSLLAIELTLRIETFFGCRLPFTQFFATPTLAEMASAVDAATAAEGDAPRRDALTVVRAGDRRRPLVLWVPGVGGTTLILQRLAADLVDGIEVMGFESAAHRGVAPPASFEELVAGCVDEIHELAAAGVIGPDRPYVLGGHSFGAGVASAVASGLWDDEHAPAGVVLVDPRYLPKPPRHSAARLAASRPRRRVRRLGRRLAGRPYVPKEPTVIKQISQHHHRLLDVYEPVPYPGPVVLVTSAERRALFRTPLASADGFLTGEVDHRPLPGRHKSMLVDERVATIAAIVGELVAGLEDNSVRQANAGGSGSVSAVSSIDR